MDEERLQGCFMVWVFAVRYICVSLVTARCVAMVFCFLHVQSVAGHADSAVMVLNGTAAVLRCTFDSSEVVQLERIRQAESLDWIKVILNDTNLTDISQLPET